MNADIDIAGLWHSQYEYGQGPDNTPLTSEHQIRFERLENLWVGQSAPQQDGDSKIALHLRENGTEFRGEWYEDTATNGYYRGREFNGTLLLLLNNEATELRGKWLGVSSSQQVKSGTWILKRCQEG